MIVETNRAADTFPPVSFTITCESHDEYIALGKLAAKSAGQRLSHADMDILAPLWNRWVDLQQDLLSEPADSGK